MEDISQRTTKRKISNPFRWWSTELPAAHESLILIYNLPLFILHSDLEVVALFLYKSISCCVLSGLPCYRVGQRLSSVPLSEHQPELGDPHWARTGGKYRAIENEGHPRWNILLCLSLLFSSLILDYRIKWYSVLTLHNQQYHITNLIKAIERLSKIIRK